MKRPLRLLAGCAIFLFFVWAGGRAADQELASGGVLTRAAAKGPTLPERVDGTRAASVSACGASSIGPSGIVTVTSCGERLSERGKTGRQTTSPRADSGTDALPVSPRSESLYQGLTAREWATRAVRNRKRWNQAEKNSDARGLTIRRLQTAARRQLAYPTGHWLDGAFLCIHRYERGAGGWATNTGNGYRGGLQFDSSFARTYGPAWAFRAFGNVERWPASVQIAAAVQAWTSRSFGPWPSTRRMCGL